MKNSKCEMARLTHKYTVALYLLLSASAGSIPGKLIVIADGAPTSYVLTGLWHTFRRTKVLNTSVDNVLTGALI